MSPHISLLCQRAAEYMGSYHARMGIEMKANAFALHQSELQKAYEVHWQIEDGYQRMMANRGKL